MRSLRSQVIRAISRAAARISPLAAPGDHYVIHRMRRGVAHSPGRGGRREEVSWRLQREIIDAQQDVIRELSTPILPVLEGVLVVPLVGRMDVARASQTMKKLLAAVSGGSVEAVIVDITGTVALDGEVVESLLAMARAVALLGAECVFVGISPSV